MSSAEAAVGAWAQTLEAVLALGDTLTAEQWAARTECPEWTVKDVYSHLVGGELWMADGHPAPSEGIAVVADRPVAQRRNAEPGAVLAELRDVYALRRRQLVGDPPDPDQPTMTAFGARVTLGVLLGHRAFDAWVHEQDIRRAVGRPGNLAAPSAHVAYMILIGAFPRVVAKLAAAPPGSSVRISVDGPVAFDDVITVDESGRGHLYRGAGAHDHTARLSMDWETFARMAAGRVSPETAAVTVHGDRDLADRVLANFAVTP